jgi:hypothetical protein
MAATGFPIFFGGGYITEKPVSFIKMNGSWWALIAANGTDDIIRPLAAKGEDSHRTLMAADGLHSI